MDIFYAPYQLKPARPLNSQVSPNQPRAGMLLKIQKEKWVGYSDLHPWPELGDAPLEDHIKSFLQKDPSFLSRVAMAQAGRDSDARKENKSLVTAEPLLKNNLLVSDLDQLTKIQLEINKKLGFEVIKVKAGQDLEKELFYCKRILETGNFGLRLDFNSSLDWASFQKFFESIPTKYIEYAEDPFEYSEEMWTEAQKFLPLALDFEAKKISWQAHKVPVAQVLIVKPQRMNMESVLGCLEAWKINFTVTSSMDHPVGVVQAYSWAQQLFQRFPKQARAPGCLTLDIYDETSYNSEISVQGPWLKPVMGPGSGFKKLLEREPWIPFT